MNKKIKLPCLPANYDRANSFKSIRISILFLFVLFTISSASFGQSDTNNLTQDTVIARGHVDEATCLLDSSRYDEAILYYKKAAFLYEKWEMWAKYAQSYHGIAKSNLKLSQPDTALVYSEKALTIAEKHLGQNSLDMANSYFHLGECFYAKRNTDKALEYYEKILSTVVDIPDKNHIIIANTYFKIGACYERKRNNKKALEYFQEALDIQLKTMKNNDPDIARTYNKIGNCNIHLRNFDEALKYYNIALNIRINLYGNNHLEVARSLNNIGVCHEYKINYTKSLEYHHKALNIRKNILGYDNTDVARSFQNLGIGYGKIGNYNQSLEYLQKCLEVRTKVLGDKHIHVAATHSNVGVALAYIADFTEAIKHFAKSVEVLIENFGPNHPEVATTYNNIGNCYSMAGNYDLAIEYFDKCLYILSKNSLNDTPLTAESFNNKGYCYLKKRNYDLAMRYYMQALDIRTKVVGNNHPDIAESYNYIGVCLEETGKYEQAMDYYKKALNVNISTFEMDHPWTAVSYEYIGNCFSKMGSGELALNYLNKSLNIRNKVFTYDHKSIAISHKKIGDHYNRIEAYQQALTHYQDALIVLIDDFQDTITTNNPSSINTNSKLTLLETLKAKAEVFSKMYDNTKKPIHLESSFSTYMLASSIVDSIKLDAVFVESEQAISENSISIYDNAISAALQLYEQTHEKKILFDAFKLAEKSKAFQLLEALNIYEAKQFAEIPDTLLGIEREIGLSLAAYKKLLDEELWKEEESKSKDKITLWQNKIFNLKRKRDSLINHFETNYPDYYSLKYSFDVATTKQIQESLDEDEAILEYFVGEEKVFVFCLTQDTIIFHPFKKDSTYDKTLSQFMNFVSSPDFQNDDEETFEKNIAAAYSLYQNLIENPLQNFGKSINKLTIIPDEYLGYLPFQALVSKKTENNNISTLRYLIEDYTINYGYSATLLLEHEEQRSRKKVDNLLAAFAPNFKPELFANENDTILSKNQALFVANITRGCSGDLNNLPNTKKEVNGIKEIIKEGKYYIDDMATKSNFMEASLNSNILHMATHACVEDRDPLYSKLYFSDGHISTYELYNMQLNTELAVLSACNTGVGEIRRGEGIMSLSRGFAYAGCPSIVTSLWAVDDKATSEIMVQFYSELKKGHDKDIALRNAQLNYLKDEKIHPNRRHPYYWAAFVQIGNHEPIEMSDINWIYYISFTLITVLILYLIFHKYKIR